MQIVANVNPTRKRIMTFDEIASVSVKYFRPNIELLAEEVAERLAFSPEQLPPCLYVNPQVTVESDLDTPEFFEKADKARATWCQRAKNMLGRHSTRSVRSWSAGCLALSEERTYWHRAACLTGLMFVDGRHVSACRWSPTGVKSENRRDKYAITFQAVFDILFELTDPEYWQLRFAAAGLTTN